MDECNLRKSCNWFCTQHSKPWPNENGKENEEEKSFYNKSNGWHKLTGIISSALSFSSQNSQFSA